MKPKHTKIFLDSGDPAETKQALELLGYLDGQTTNPSLIIKNPDLQKKISAGLLAETEVWQFYKTVVTDIAQQLPQGSISIEVYADHTTPAQTMVAQARMMNSWIPNAHIKFPITAQGLLAAHQFISEGGRVNLTLIFSQEQSAAVYAATTGATPGSVFVSPFVGRLDDIGINGMDLIKHTMNMFAASDHHVEVLVASVRHIDHFLSSIQLGADIITAPLKILKEWVGLGSPIPNQTSTEKITHLQPIPYHPIPLDKPMNSYNIQHDLTDAGIKKFVADWRSIIQ